MAVLDRLFGRSRSGDGPAQGFSGMVRIGSSYYNAKWNFSRVLNEVYANPTGYRCVNLITDDFSRPPWAIFSDESPNKAVTGGKADELLGVLNKPDAMLSGTAMQRHIAMDLELNGRTFWLQMRGKDMWGDNGPLTGLKRLPCENITVVTNFDRDLVGFIYTSDDGKRIPLLPSEVLYSHYSHPQNPWEGFPPAYVAGLPATIDERAKLFNFRLLENDGALPGYVTVDGLVPEEFEKFKALWAAGEEPGKTRFLAGKSVGYTVVGSSNKEMMQDKIREQSQQDIARSFGMSMLVLSPDDATFANGNVARVTYMSTKIGSMWTLVADQWTTQIQDDYPGLRIGFELSGIEELGEAKDDLSNRTMSLYTGGLISDEEARADLGRGLKSDAVGTFVAPMSAGADTSDIPPEAEPEVKALPAATATKSALVSSGVCVAFWLSPTDAKALAIADGEAPEQMHCTLAYLGKTDDPAIDQSTLEQVLADFAKAHSSITGSVSGKGEFVTPDGDAVVALVDAPDLATWRNELVDAIEAAGLPVNHDHGYTPHITLGYFESGEGSGVQVAADYQLAWNSITLAWGGSHTPFALVDKATAAKSAPLAVTKAVNDWQTFNHRVESYEAKAARKMNRFFAKQSRVIAATIRSRRGKSLQKAVSDFFDNTRWNAELGDEASDMFSDVIDSFGTWTMANLPTAKKFDPTHDRVTKYIQGRSTDAAGLVNETTEKQLRASIDALESQGLGVDDIAKGIEDYFETNGPVRAQAWARTETIGSSNFAALEGARQSGVVTGKSWLTAAGADEDCTALEDIGTIGIDESFDDFAQPPAHVNCRCALLFSTDSGAETEDDSNG